jgi:hypothetical protein
MRRIGTTASVRWKRPRRMRRRSPSRATENPANETSEPIAESAQATRASATTASSQPLVESGRSRVASSKSRSFETVLLRSWNAPASAGRMTPS